VPNRSFISLLGLFILAGSVAFAQQNQKPSHSMQAFRSETELLQYFAALDRSRPSRGGSPASCPDSSQQNKNGYVITGRVESSTGKPVPNAVIGVAGLEACALAKSDGSYRLVIPRKDFQPDSTITVSAAFIGYRMAAQTIRPRGRNARADFMLKENPLQMSEMVVTDAAPAAASMDAMRTDKNESITNTQHAGVDEGGIVKVHGDYLVVLRRGRLFTISIHDRELRPVAIVDAYPPGADPA